MQENVNATDEALAEFFGGIFIIMILVILVAVLIMVATAIAAVAATSGACYGGYVAVRNYYQAFEDVVIDGNREIEEVA